jgi:uncharacterized phage protein (TIGR02220 family)
MHYYQHHIGDYAQATAHLSMLEDAAYSRMLRWYYAEEKPLPADAAAVCRLVRATSKQERDAVEVVLSEFFELREDGHHQKRADAEIAKHVQDIPDIEHKRENERERQRRARERRKQLFEELRCHGVVPDFDTPTRDLQELLSRVTSGVTDRDVTQPVTRDVTANQEPRTKNQEPKNKTPLSGKPDQMAEVREVLTFLRNMTGRAYREVPPTVNLIKSRLKNTSVDDIKRVLVHKGEQWLDDPEMQQFLRPSTLFRPSNFEQYLAEALSTNA